MGKKSKRMKTDAKTYRGTLDEVLANKSLWRKAIAKDGSCLFRAVAEQVYCSQHYHHRVREKCVEYIDAHRDDFKEFITISLDQYLEHLSRELWGGEMELVVLSRLYERSIIVYHELESNKIQEQVFSTGRDEEKMSALDNLANPILLAYLDGNHYDGVYTHHHAETLSFCQGLLYTSLMERVFRDIIPWNCKKKLTQLHDSDIDRIISLRREKQTNNTVKDPETKMLFNLGRHYGEDEVVAMSWTKYHNSALHFHKKKRESTEAKDRTMAANIQFRIRDKCSFFIDGKRMTGEIAALNSKPGQHLVHIHQSENDQWEIPANELTLLSSTQSSRKSWKKQQPLQHSVEQETSSCDANPAPAARKHQQLKTQASPAHVLNPSEVSTSPSSSVPFTSVKANSLTINTGSHPRLTSTASTGSTPRPTTTTSIGSTPRTTTTASTGSIPRPNTTASTGSTTRPTTTASTGTTPRPNTTASTGTTPRPNITASTGTTPRTTTSTGTTPRPNTTASTGTTPRPNITASTGTTPRPTTTESARSVPRPSTTGSTPRLTTTATTAHTGSTPRPTSSGSTRRPNTIATAYSSVDHIQKSGQEGSRRKPKHQSKSLLTTIEPLQANKSLVKPPAPLKASSQSSSTPVSSSSRLNPSPSDPVKMAPYSSIVKKTSGGPSGSLTSEETEYASSGEEEAEGTTSGISVPSPATPPPLPAPTLVPTKLSSDIPHGQQQGCMHQKAYSQDKLSPVLKEVEENIDPSRIDAYVSQKKQDNFLPGQVEKSIGSGPESPYLERKVLSDDPLHQEAWPLIHHEDHPHHSKEKVEPPPFVPPQNTMLFAAAMTNNGHHGHTSPPVPPIHSKSMSSLPFSSIPLTSSAKRGGGYTDLFGILQQHSRAAVTHNAPSPQTQPCSPEGGEGGKPIMSPYLPHSPPQQTTKNLVSSSSGGTVPDSGCILLDKSLGYHSPASSLSTVATLQGQYQCGELPPLFAAPVSSSVYPSSESRQHLINHFQPVPSTASTSRRTGPETSGEAGPGITGGTGPDINGGTGHGIGGGGTSPPRHTLYSNAGQIPSSLGHGSISSVTVTNSRHFSMMENNSETKMMQGIYEVRSTDAPAYINSHGSLHVPSERIKGTPTSSPTMTSTAVTTKTTSSASAMTSQSLHIGMKVIAPPPSTADVLSQTDLTGVPEVKDRYTQTSDTFVPVEALGPPSLSMDTLADKVMFGIKYSLQCLSVYSHNCSTSTSDLESTLEELLQDRKLDELFVLQQLAPQLPSLYNEQQCKHVDVTNQFSPYSHPSFDAKPHACVDNTGSDGGNQSVSNLVARKEDVMPEQEQFMRSSDLAGMGVPPPLPHPNYPMMMQRPHPHLPPFIVPTPSHVPMYYPMMHPHLSMPPVMGFMPFMPPMPPRVAPANIPPVDQQQQQLDSHPSSPYQVSTEDQPVENEQTQQGDANVMLTLDQLEKQSEMMASNAFPIPTLALVQHDLQQESTEPPTVDELPPVSSSLPLGTNAPKHEVIVSTPLHVGMTASHSKDRKVEEREGGKEPVEETIVQRKSVIAPSFVSLEKNEVVVHPQVKNQSSDHGIVTMNKPTPKSTPPPSPCQPVISHPMTTQHSWSSVNPPQHVSARHAKKSPQYKSSGRNESNQPGLPCRPSSNQPLPEWTGGKESHEGGTHEGGKPRGGQTGENQHKKGSKRSHKYGGKRRSGDHSSSNNSAGVLVPIEPSDYTSKPSQQDPIRQFPMSNLAKKDRDQWAELDPIGDTMVFRALPSPTSNLDLIICSTNHCGVEHVSSTSVGDRGITSKLGFGETKWPDLNELVVERSTPVKQTQKKTRISSKQDVDGDPLPFSKGKKSVKIGLQMQLDRNIYTNCKPP